VSTTQERFKNAVKAIRKDGILWRTNVRQCCRGCITPKQLGMSSHEDPNPYAYTYGSQGSAIKWNRDGTPTVDVGRYQSVPAKIEMFVNWGNGSAEKVLAAFRAEGFTADWTGSEHHCVIVVLSDSTI